MQPVDQLIINAFCSLIISLEKIGVYLGKNKRTKTGHPYKDIDPRQFWARQYLSWRYIRGTGLEIGALHLPLRLFNGAQAQYVDYVSSEDAKKHYPELADFNLVTPNFIENGEELPSIGAESQDFIIANHFIEHCQDPCRTLATFFSKLKSGGILFLAVPMRDYTFDRERALTPSEHLVEDFKLGAERSREAHYHEWVTYVEKCEEKDRSARAEKLMNENYSIHFHVWNYKTFLEFLRVAKEQIGQRFEIVSSVEWSFNPFEAVYLLRKI